MQTLTATLVHNNGNQRFYKLNIKLTKSFDFNGHIIDLPSKLKENLKWFKDEYLEIAPKDGLDLICVSDAHTHSERLVFGAIVYNGSTYGRIKTQIDGCHTMMIHGGDTKRMKPDYVYLRRLARINGFAFHYSCLSK